MKYFWSIIAILGGLVLIKYAFPLVNMFGKIPWAENKMGSMGGTYMLYKLAGVVIIILAMLYMFNAMDFLVGPIAPLFGGK